ncbi:MAG: iron chelate uptake ABC transporter family permease subunit [Candidatus Doudnabacteria bacterium]
MSHPAGNLPILVPFLVIILILVAIFSLSVGPANISFKETAKIGLSELPFVNFQKINPIDENIILHIRLPRVILAIITGMALAVAGVVLQALLRNPLADPYVIGVSSGAALGATLAIILGLISLISLAGFLGAVLAMFLVYSLSRTGYRVPVKTLLLAGVIVSVFLSALVSLIASLMGESMYQIILWLMGNLSEANITLTIIAGFLVLIGIITVSLFARDLNVISIGEEEAQHLGVEVETVKKILFIITSLITGAVVALTGLIGFVGLVIPHIMRLIVGPDHRVLIIASLLAGGIFLTLADLVARTIISPAEIPVGVITAILGGPFFLFLLRRKK